MNTKEIVRHLANEKKITIAELERKLEIANGTIGRWDRQNPSIEPLQKLADYFGVSTDYLLGRVDSEDSPSDKNRDDLTEFFKAETNGMSDSEVATLEKEWKEYLIIRKRMMRGE